MCPHAAAFAGLTYVLVMAAEGAHAAPHPHSCQLDAALCCKPYTYECTSEGNRCKQGDADCFPWASSAAATQIEASPVATPAAGSPTAPDGSANSGPLPVVPGVGAQPPLPAPSGGSTSPVGAGGPLPAPGAGGPLPVGVPGTAGPLPASGTGGTSPAGVPGAGGPLPAPGAGGTLPAGAAATDAPAVSDVPPTGGIPSSLGAPFATATLRAGGPSSSQDVASASAVSAPPPALGASPDTHQTTGTNLGLAVGLPIALIAALTFAAWLLWRRTRVGHTSSPVGIAAKGMTPDLAGLGATPVLASSTMVAERPFVPFVPPPQATPTGGAAATPKDVPAMTSYGNVGAAGSVQPMAGGEHLSSAAEIGGIAAGLAAVGGAASTAPQDVSSVTSYGNVGAARNVQPMAGGEHFGSAAEIGGTAAGLGAVGGTAAGLAAANAATKADASHHDSPSRSLPRSGNGTLRSLGSTNLDNSSRSLAGGFAGGSSTSLNPAHGYHAEDLAAAAALGAGAAAIHHHHNESESTLRHSASASSLDADAMVKQYSRGNSLSSLASSLGRNNGGLDAGAGAGPSASASSDHDALAALALGAGAGGVAAASAAHRAGSVSSRSSRYLGGVAGGLARRGTLHTRDEVVTVVDERTGHVLDKKTVTVTQYEGDMTDLEAHTAQIEIAGSEIAKVGETVTVEYADSHGGSPGEEVTVDGGRATVMTTVVDGAGDVVSIKTTSSIKDPPSPGSASYRGLTPPNATAEPSGADVSPLALAGAALAVDEGLRAQASRSTLSDTGTLDTVTRPRQGSHASTDAAGRAYDSDRTVVRSMSSNDTLAPAGQAQAHDTVGLPTSGEQVQSADNPAALEVQSHGAEDVSSPQPQPLAAAVPPAQTLWKDEPASTTVSQSQSTDAAGTPAPVAAATSPAETEKSTPAPLAAPIPRPPPTTLTSFPPFPRRSTPSVPEEDDYPDLSAYHPPAPTSHVCVQAYYPVRPDEMQMQVGDLVGIEREYPDGWARGQNITHGRKRAHFPLGILAPIKSGPSQRVARIGGRSWLGRAVGGSGANVVEERRRMSVIPPRDQSLPLRRRPTNASSSTLHLTSDEASGKSSSSSRGSNDADAAEEDEVHVLETHTETSHGADGDTTETTRTLVGAAPSRGSDGHALRERPSATNLVTKVVKTAHTRNPDGTLTKRVSVSITDTPSV
ncbi:hypothetical protein HDU88_001002 [Geranomyces variabilis]|nr:hypothetical protein HDU88_001002 [Geranomyces variabilis]